MNDQATSLLNKDQLAALKAARFEDIFSVLGMHQHPSGKGLIARVFLPGATAVDVIATPVRFLKNVDLLRTQAVQLPSPGQAGPGER